MFIDHRTYVHDHKNGCLYLNQDSCFSIKQSTIKVSTPIEMPTLIYMMQSLSPHSLIGAYAGWSVTTSCASSMGSWSEGADACPF